MENPPDEFPEAPHQDGDCPGVFGGCADCVAWCERFEALLTIPWPTRLEPERPSFTCPHCGRISYHPKDIQEKYCPQCHWWTGVPELYGPWREERRLAALEAANGGRVTNPADVTDGPDHQPEQTA